MEKVSAWDRESGRTSFPALHARVSGGRRLPAVTASQPAILVVFDVVESSGTLTTGDAP
ncbi:hypothetical protein [Actinoplanes xinjiangensis]|uniref:Uncharacterized protein n=1 Tax=Actinoplanes xinjiangensis TaxID=512350 RepID=A0A316EA13_9ACTN|nr:hypothetical protein [Actinoplanes xinjiangensis]PWK27237.1 hypothetical protein BC793_15619 [Actinoplanes xinjiangensis]GIF45270.1 hypothetical protein Axi01nite_95810 [Actinoplanes xinjiangensis]